MLPEWHKTLAAVGGRDDVQRFTARALARLGSGLEPLRRGFKAPLDALARGCARATRRGGFRGDRSLGLHDPPAARCRPVQRSHPLVSVLAETLLERTLAQGSDQADPGVLGRVGCWVTSGVTSRTTVVLLRIRHQFVSQNRFRTKTLLVEEANAVAWVGLADAPIEGTDALALLTPLPLADPPSHVRERAVTQALEQLGAQLLSLESYAERRARALLEDHRRVRRGRRRPRQL